MRRRRKKVRHKTRHRRRRSAEGSADTALAVFERLEPRILFSTDSPLADPAIVGIQWGDEVAQVIANEWIIRLVESEVKTDQLAASLVGYGFQDPQVRNLGGNGFGVVTLSDGAYEDISAWADLEDDVLYVEPNFVHVMGEIIESTPPNDSGYASLWGLSNTGQTGGTVDADIDALEAWGLSTGSSDVVVAIIDTGIDYTHSDLSGNMWVNPGEIARDGIDNDGNGYVDDIYGWDFAYNDSDPFDGHHHGTHVAGTIGAVGNNSTGVVGVNWDVKLMAMKFLSDGGSGSTSGAIGAINYVTMMKRDYGVNVVATNNSWGGGGYSQALSDAIAAGGAEGVLFIAAAGNSGNNTDIYASYPSSYGHDRIISVAATDHNDGRAGFSNYGATSVDLAAPGVSIYSTVPGNGYASYSGTSMATPHVAGVVGLLAAGNPQATVDQIKAAIMDGADTVASMAGRAVTGGRLNAYNALQLIGGQDIRPPTVESVSPSGIFAPVDTITIVFSEDILAQSVVGGNFLLRSSGADGVFDTPDDNVLTIDTASLSQAQPNRVVINLGQMLPVGGYRLTLVDTGENPIRDPAGNALGGGDAIHFFEIAEMVYVSEPNDILAQAVDSGLNGTGDAIFSGTIGDGAVGARDVDLFALQVEAGMVLSADIDAWENGSTLNSLLRVFDADGNELTFNDDIHGSDSFIEYALTRAGTYYVGVSGFGNF